MQIILNRTIFILIVLILSVFVTFSQNSLFPEIPGWKTTQEDPVYDANNLWDIIDGAADLFLEYSFIDLHIARYLSDDSIEVKAELYRHSSEVNAFGIYSQERDPGYSFIKIGVQGYLQQGVLNFLTGVYYIKLSTFQTGNRAQEALLIIARKLDEHLMQNNSFPQILNKFPLEGKLPNTEQYASRNFLGYSTLSNAYTAVYKDSLLFKVLIIETDGVEQAEKMLSEFKKALPKEATIKVDGGRSEIRGTPIGLIELQRTNRFISGVLNCPINKIRNRYLKKVSADLSN